MKKIILIIVSLILIGTVIALTGENNNINVTSGQIEISPIKGEFSSAVRGAVQYIVGFGSSGNIETRYGILATNYTPFKPLLISPSNNSFKNDNKNILLGWLAEDPNNDPLTSGLGVYNDSVLTQIYYINDTIDVSSYTLTIPEEITLYWRVLTNNTMENSTYSDVSVFTTDYTFPTEFNLTTPLNNTISKDTTPELSWLPTTELNLDNYTIEFCIDINCNNVSITENTSTESFSTWSTSNALEQKTYYWQVKAFDKANNENISDLFIYTVEPSTTTTITTTTGGGGGETVGGTGVQLYSLSIISPPDITIYSNDTLTIPLIITNPATLITLRDIELNVSSDSDDVAPFLAATFIPQLRPKEQRTVPLTITTHTLPGTYGITITAHVLRPDFTDKVRILANLIEKDSAEKSKVSNQLGFARDLLDGNPECLDLQEYIKEAESSLQESKYDQALNLAENAIQSCQKLISTKRISIKQPILEMPYVIKENKTVVIVIAESLAFILFLLIIFKLIRKKKSKE